MGDRTKCPTCQGDLARIATTTSAVGPSVWTVTAGAYRKKASGRKRCGNRSRTTTGDNVSSLLAAGIILIVVGVFTGLEGLILVGVILAVLAILGVF